MSEERLHLEPDPVIEAYKKDCRPHADTRESQADARAEDRKAHQSAQLQEELRGAMNQTERNR
jgi:hypothetical protein